MPVKAALIDFDYTITKVDTLDLLAKRLGVESETAELDRLFWEGKLPGLQGLVRRINLLKGLKVSEIQEILEDDGLYREGVEKLFRYFKNNNIVTIIASGNIYPVLEAANQKLGADYLVCSRPHIVDGVLDHISEGDYSNDSFKITDCSSILESLGIPRDSTIAIGDSPADKSLFEYASISFVVEPKSGVEKYATYNVGDDLTKVVTTLSQLREADLT